MTCLTREKNSHAAQHFRFYIAIIEFKVYFVPKLKVKYEWYNPTPHFTYDVPY